ncbi:hypothetical protein GALMADRAFT_140797 [Galerina marginata CBS 339.88]|uniref:Uncharacterized protein n=1 Tax=Galerina marginata (strain CBS 339.88) TaxID=685588 RepID=A0A067SWJ1_GALM3|nr:hypothetical protein GALMADRAFT_140797 [Galerina marginata CBS 339.88]
MSVDTIPAELLAEIFRASLDDVPISPHTAPLLVTRVSKKWRQVALSDSFLWACLSISITPTDCSSILALWLACSASQPLSITLHIDPFAHLAPKTRDIAHTVFQLLAGASDRWHRLSVVLPGSHQLFASLCSAATHAPNLHSLSLKLGNWSAEEAWDLNALLQRAPAVRALTWSNRCSWGTWDSPFDSGVEHLTVSWANLTHILLDTWITLKSTLYILRQCTSVVSLDLRHFSSGHELLEADDPSRGDIIHLPHLQSLSIYQLKLDNGPAALFDRLLCPALHAFNFTCGFVERVSWPQAAFHSFLTRSVCTLRSLMLEFTGISEDQLIQCLTHSSASLERLEVYDARGDICVGDAFLDMLRVQTDADAPVNSFCPNLHTLILHRVVSCTDGALASALKLRLAPQQSSVRLCNVDILFSKRFHKSNTLDMHYLQSISEG